MKLYRVLLSTKTSITFNPQKAGYNFRGKDFTIALRKINSQTDRELAGSQHGWLLEYEGEAANINEALQFAYDTSEYFLSVLSLETGVESHRSNMILAYNITPRISEREFVQFYHDSPFSRLQIAELSTYNDHLHAVLLYDGPRKDRLSRSIRWFRKGLNEDDPLDQFLALWQGLETLNPVLADHYSCENGGIEDYPTTCVRTGQTYYASRTTKKGIEQLVADQAVDKKLWKDINILRNDIAHGRKPFQGIYDDCIRLSPEVGKLLHEGISLILGFEYDEKVKKHISNITPIKVGGTVVLEIVLHEEDIDKLGKDYPHPFFRLNADVEPIQEGDRAGFLVKSVLKPSIGCRNYSSGSFAVSGRGVTIEIDSVE